MTATPDRNRESSSEGLPAEQRLVAEESCERWLDFAPPIQYRKSHAPVAQLDRAAVS